mgnify:CR=1 FL=1
MYGLEKEPEGKFSFDLEKEIKENPARAKEILKKVEEVIHEIKDTLRKGANEKEFDDLEILLQGYVSLQKILKKISK